jgi:hypothetical protein
MPVSTSGKPPPFMPEPEFGEIITISAIIDKPWFIIEFMPKPYKKYFRARITTITIDQQRQSQQ